MSLLGRLARSLKLIIVSHVYINQIRHIASILIGMIFIIKVYPI